MALRRINPSKQHLLHLPRLFSSFSNLSIPTFPPPPPSDDPDARFPPANHGEPASQKPGASSLDRFHDYLSIKKIERQLEKNSPSGVIALTLMEQLRNRGFPIGWPNAHTSPFKIKKDDEKKSTKTIKGVASTAEPSQRADDVTDMESDDEFQDERELEKEVSLHQNDDDLQKLDQAVTAEQKDQEDEQVNQRSGADGAKDKPKKSPKKPKRNPKKSSGDDLVGEMQRFVDVKENDASKEDAMDFSIARCIKLVGTLEGLTPPMKFRCYNFCCNVFNSTKNREIFINAVAKEDGSALEWLKSQIGAVNGVASTAEPSRRYDVTDVESDGEFQDERELEKEASVHQNDGDFQKIDQGLTTEQKDQEDEQVNQRMGAGGAKDKHKKSPKKPKRSPKKSSGDDLVGEMQRSVDVKENEASKEDAMDFSIARCIKLLRSLEGVTPAMKARCYNVFKSAKNCEIFISAVAEEDDSALAWLKSQIGNSTCPPWQKKRNTEMKRSPQIGLTSV